MFATAIYFSIAYWFFLFKGLLAAVFFFWWVLPIAFIVGGILSAVFVPIAAALDENDWPKALKFVVFLLVAGSFMAIFYLSTGRSLAEATMFGEATMLGAVLLGGPVVFGVTYYSGSANTGLKPTIEKQSERKRREANWPADTSLGQCPSCDSDIPFVSTECPYCRALFGANSAWSVLPKREKNVP